MPFFRLDTRTENNIILIRAVSCFTCGVGWVGLLCVPAPPLYQFAFCHTSIEKT